MKINHSLFVFNVAIRANENKYSEYPSIVELAGNPEEYVDVYGGVQIRAKDAKMEDMPAEM